jgi:hypothetical protein
MRRRLLFMMASALLAAFVTCCSVGDYTGTPAGLIPDVGNGVTDVGNPNEDEITLPKATYVNREFNIQITYPGSVDLMELGTGKAGTAEVVFSSDKGESVTATFVRLAEGQGFSEFLEEIRGGKDRLYDMNARNFDRVLCDPSLTKVDEDGMRAVECYNYKDSPKGAFVMALIGVFMPSTTFDADVILALPNAGPFVTPDSNIKPLPVQIIQAYHRYSPSHR